jgi:hypothetical protein
MCVVANEVFHIATSVWTPRDGTISQIYFTSPFLELKMVSPLSYLSCIHISLIDMCSVHDDEYSWILQAKDQYTEYIWAYPLKCKNTTIAIEKLLHQFYTFGAPETLQFDDEHEFMLDLAKVVCFF